MLLDSHSGTLVRQPSAEAVGELLRRAPRCPVKLDAAVEKLERVTEGPMQLVGVVTAYRESTAMVRPFGSECTHDGKPTRLQCLQHLGHVAVPLLGRGEKVEHRAVVPDIVLRSLQLGCRC